MALLLYLLLITFFGYSIYAFLKLKEQKQKLIRYSSVSDLDDYKDQLKSANQRLSKEADKKQDRIEGLNKQLKKLEAELDTLEVEVDIQTFGHYQKHYDFPSSSAYKIKLEMVLARQKEMIKANLAVICTADWRVEGSKAKGDKMVKEQSKLMLRAFNGECDAAIAKVKYNNVVNIEKRLVKSFDQLNKLGKTKSMHISLDYFNLKVDELHLVHEYREKLQIEKEVQREIKEKMREEERAQREIEKAKKEAEKEEKKQQKDLDAALKELANASAEKSEALQAKIAELESRLRAAQANKEKAISMAQLTKAGHVYVISNIGSFGEGIYKIGMTRRLEPLDRVKELSSASVPFNFDVHAMIYSENAPELEKQLHNQFEHRRLNKINTRREFFRVTLNDIESVVQRCHGEIVFTHWPEAPEYRQSLALSEEQAVSVA